MVMLAICCVDCMAITWTESANSQVYGGRRSPSANTVETCKAACVDNSVCTGLDWDPTQVVGERCWLHGPWSETEVHSATGVTHYDIRRTDTCNGMSDFNPVQSLGCDGLGWSGICGNSSITNVLYGCISFVKTGFGFTPKTGLGSFVQML